MIKKIQSVSTNYISILKLVIRCLAYKIDGFIDFKINYEDNWPQLPRRTKKTAREPDDYSTSKANKKTAGEPDYSSSITRTTQN